MRSRRLQWTSVKVSTNHVSSLADWLRATQESTRTLQVHHRFFWLSVSKTVGPLLSTLSYFSRLYRILVERVCVFGSNYMCTHVHSVIPPYSTYLPSNFTVGICSLCVYIHLYIYRFPFDPPGMFAPHSHGSSFLCFCTCLLVSLQLRWLKMKNTFSGGLKKLLIFRTPSVGFLHLVHRTGTTCLAHRDSELERLRKLQAHSSHGRLLPWDSCELFNHRWWCLWRKDRPVGGSYWFLLILGIPTRSKHGGDINRRHRSDRD
jgi:hypothetical protein